MIIVKKGPLGSPALCQLLTGEKRKGKREREREELLKSIRRVVGEVGRSNNTERVRVVLKRKKEKEAMGWIGETMDSIKSIQIRQVLTQGVSLGSFPLSLSLSELVKTQNENKTKILSLRYLMSI